MANSPRAMVFDAYGTLYDVHSVASACERRWPGAGAALSQAWRTRQLEYTWLRSLMRRHADFEQVTREALRHVSRGLGLGLAPADEDALLEEYRRLAPFPDAAECLAALAPRPLAILSNGSPSMLDPLLRSSGLDRWIGRVLSVEAVRTYKPAPEVYRLALDALGLPPGDIGFVSANGWDAGGAKAFGFRVFWINRSGAPAEELGVAPDHELTSLGALARLVREMDRS